MNLPYVRVSEENVPNLAEDLDYVWIDATFTSDTEGTFSASSDYVSFYSES